MILWLFSRYVSRYRPRFRCLKEQIPVNILNLFILYSETERGRNQRNDPEADPVLFLKFYYLHRCASRSLAKQLKMFGSDFYGIFRKRLSEEVY